MDYISRIEKILKKQKKNTKIMLEELGYSHSLINGWKKGSEPSALKLLKICEYLNTNIEYILTGKENITERLTAEEKELIYKYRMLSEKEKMKELARLELIAEQEEEKELDNTKLSS